MVADMVEVDQIAALAAKSLFHLQRNPFGTISDGMNPALFSKARRPGAAEELLSRLLNAALQRSAIAQRFAPRLMRQA